MSDFNLYRPGEASTPIATKGVDVMDSLILSQYREKPNLREYMLAYMEEMDLLFEELGKVYSGRFLENASGIQLDIVGQIIGQLRNVELPTIWFGFDGAVNIDNMADEATPSDGGLFRDEFLENFETFPLDDETYRRLLRAKAYLHTKESADINTAYGALYRLVTKIPEVFNIVTLGDRRIELQMSSGDTSNSDSSLIIYLSKYFVPMGTAFSVLRI